MKEIICFGTGNYFETKKSSIEEEYKIIGFIDSAVHQGEQGYIKDGVKVVSPAEIGIFPDVPVALCSVEFFEMWKVLMEQGVDEKRILFGPSFTPLYDSLEKELYNNDACLYAQNNHIVLKKGAKEYSFKYETDFKAIIRDIYSGRKEIDMIRQLPQEPISRRFGAEHGTPVDRYYIEKFLKSNSGKMNGTVMEIADDRYMSRFADNAQEKLILHVNGWGGKNVIKGNFATGEGIEENTVDCLICTQTIQCIFNLKEVMQNIHKILKPGGTVLLTASGISEISLYDERNWGEYWRLTKKSMYELLISVFDDENVQVSTYGNVKTATAFLYGLSVEDLSEADYAYNDSQYPIVITAEARKGSSINYRQEILSDR